MFHSILDSDDVGATKMDISVEELDTLPERLRINAGLLNYADKALVMNLLAQNQHHLFGSWDALGVNDQAKREMLTQLHSLDAACGPTGLVGYLTRARGLLNTSRSGKNPLDDWTPSMPTLGESLFPLNDAFDRYEAEGLKEIGRCGFVLVAGGLGERLGYSGIKVALPVETITRRSYLQHYCEQILAVQTRFGVEDVRVPLAIMVSDDTESLTRELLEKHDFFGLSVDQVTILKQQKVPALSNNLAHIALSSQYVVDSKPHGHGDVHSLLFHSGTAARWKESGVRWLLCFQDTNALAFNALPVMLGVSCALSLDMNSMAVPRVAQQAVGAITKLTHTDGRELTINVEYNQLDPLLRATGHPDGDVNDPLTHYSPYPGNINTLLFRLAPYLDALSLTQGVMPEFVNPKYKDSTLRNEFKKPTRLECMMQDFPQLWSQTGIAARVGFTIAPAWFCYSPCKNNAKDAAASVAQGVPASAAFTAESDQVLFVSRVLYLLQERERLKEEEEQRKRVTETASEGETKSAEEREREKTSALSAALAKHMESEETRTFLGITAALGPRVVLSPSTAVFASEIAQVFPRPRDVSLASAWTTLSLAGRVVVERLALEGSLAVDAREREREATHKTPRRILVRVPAPLELVTTGHAVLSLDECAQDESVASTLDETDRMRGYRWRENETVSVSFADLSRSARESEEKRATESEDEAVTARERDRARLDGETDFVFTGKHLVPLCDVDCAQHDAAKDTHSTHDKDERDTAQEQQQQVQASGGWLAKCPYNATNWWKLW